MKLMLSQLLTELELKLKLSLAKCDFCGMKQILYDMDHLTCHLTDEALKVPSIYSDTFSPF